MALGSSLEPGVKTLLESQQYKFVGSHSAVKLCGWTKKSLKGEGVCYKQQFYGINSHRCVQMSVAVNFCDMDCVYCWRERNNSAFREIDEPADIIDKAIEAQKKLVSGFKGEATTNAQKWKEARKPIHFAISLTGEMLYYPKLGELIKLLKHRKLTSFLVTNGQLPEVLAKIEMPTQVYISLDSPDEATHKKLCKPSQKDSWSRLLKSLDILKRRKPETRTSLRITLIKGMNDFSPEGYAALIKRAQPDFVEVKAYMFVGASCARMAKENMPEHSEVKAFATEISKYCDYITVDEHPKSRVVLLTNKDSKERMLRF